MRKTLLITVLVLTALGCYSKECSIVIPGDTTRPVSEQSMKNALRTYDSLQTMKRERDSMYNIISLYEKLAIKDSQLIAVTMENVRLANKNISLLEGQVKSYEKLDTNSQQLDKNNRAIIRKKNWQIIKKTLISATIIGGLILILTKKKL